MNDAVTVTSAKDSWYGSYLKLSESSVRVQNMIVIFIVLIYATINILSVRREFSLTRDEDKHYLYGKNVAFGNSDRFDDSKMPVTALNALPQKIAQFSGIDRLIQIGDRFSTARSVTILFSCLIAFLVFYWSRALYGFIAALFSLLLYVLDPNISAHSQLVTTDIYATGTIVFASFWLWKFANDRSPVNGLWCLIALGISQVAKYTAVVLFPLFLVTLLVYDFSPLGRMKRGDETAKAFALRYLRYAIFTAVVVMLIINVCFLFNRTFTPFGEYAFRSSLFLNVQDNIPFLNRFRVPVPYPYLEGLDLIRFNEQSGSSYGNLYLLGNISAVKGFPGYFIIASLLKVPIATQIILILALVIYISRKDRRINFIEDEIFLFVPVTFFTLYFNFFFNAQIGIRYYLPVFPLLYVFSGNLFSGWKSFSVSQKVVSWGAIVYLFVSVFSYYPYNLSYFNEFVWDRKQAYKYLADSNLDWGQSKNEYWQYISEHPRSFYQPKKIRSGLLIVGVNDLVGVTADPGQYAWLRNNFEPVETIAYSYLVYKISPEDIDKLCATTVYCDN